MSDAHLAPRHKPALELRHAQAAAARMRSHDKTVTAYRCQECGGWHVGGSNGYRAVPLRIRSHQQLFSNRK